MTRLFARRYKSDDLQQPVLPTPNTLPPHSPTDVETDNDLLQPVQNWSHPFRDKRDALQQLTHLANASSGSYPLGSSGLWHGGVHFDAGTAGTLDQSSVHCIADGEVVAYRMDEQSSATTYFVNQQPVSKPFSRNFVLVRHRLQPPAIKGSADTPPSLIIYSLYMHLRDWAAYEKDPSIVRPGFWKPGSTLQVRVDVNDIHGDYPGQRGLNVRNKASKGAIIGWLPRGTEVQVSGEGTYRKLENTPGPDHLKDASGALRGYVSADFLRPMAGGQHRVVSETPLNVRAQPMVRKGNEIGTLNPGTEVTVSGTGRFRKLERVNQYVHFASLQSGAAEPEARGSVVVRDKPVAIKAGELIGHVGRYHEGAVDYPENRLHLEVFSAGDVKTFLRLSRLWADKLPASSRTWLKLVKGTPVVAHQGTFSSKKPPTLKAAGHLSAAQLLLPKSLIDGLPAERKIAVPASGDSKACNWYRLDGLLHDADNNLLDGWVREEVGGTPWLSPWSWEGYETLADYDSPRSMLASFMRASGRFNEDDIAHHGAAAHKADQGPIKKRLFDIIDRNRDGKLSGNEIQAALRLPAHAQSISQLIVRYQSEWHHVPGKWDALDDLLGHGGATPNRNWLAEKERIREMSWWGEVAERLGLPADGKVHHLHPVGLLSFFSSPDRLQITPDQLKQIFPQATSEDIALVIDEINGRLLEFRLDTRLRQRHFFAQVKGEVGPAMKGITESWEYSASALKSFSSYYRTHPGEADADAYLKNLQGKIVRSSNQRAIGRKHFQRLNGNRMTHSEDGFNFRGRGLIQITGYEKYHDFMQNYSIYWPGTVPDTVANPELINEMPNAIRSALWFWVSYKIYESESGRGLADVGKVTRRVNGGAMGLTERKEAYELIEGVLL